MYRGWCVLIQAIIYLAQHTAGAPANTRHTLCFGTAGTACLLLQIRRKHTPCTHVHRHAQQPNTCIHTEQCALQSVHNHTYNTMQTCTSKSSRYCSTSSSKHRTQHTSLLQQQESRATHAPGSPQPFTHISEANLSTSAPAAAPPRQQPTGAC